MEDEAKIDVSRNKVKRVGWNLPWVDTPTPCCTHKTL